MTDLSLGHTRLIIQRCQQARLSTQQTAYVLATAFWETARTMEPVKEAYWLSEDWRKRNLRYYPWYGRGFVQLTWRENYVRAGSKLGHDFTTDPEKVMEPDISAAILVVGMVEGWFTGKKLSDYINATRTDYVGARWIVNGTDKAKAIAEIAREYEAALLRSASAERPPRESVSQSTTVQASVAAAVSGAGGVATALSQLEGTAQLIVIGTACVAALALLWIMRERLRKWAEGDR